MGQVCSILFPRASARGVSANKADITHDPDVARVCKLHEWKAVALTLAEAFEQDEVARYFLDTPDTKQWSSEEKWKLHLKIMEYVAYAHLLKGLVVTAGENYGCVALWMGPGQNMDDIFTQLRSGMWRLHYKLTPEGRLRFFSDFLPLLHNTKASILGPRDDDSWYLVYLGTRPAHRGRGLSRKCVEYVTRIADRDGQVCYLESSNAINPRIYARFGFETKTRIHLKRQHHVVMDIMTREPGSRDKTDSVKGKE